MENNKDLRGRISAALDLPNREETIDRILAELKEETETGPQTAKALELKAAIDTALKQREDTRAFEVQVAKNLGMDPEKFKIF